MVCMALWYVCWCCWSVFLENDQGRAVISDRSGRMLTDYFCREIEDYDLNNMWFQQDGARIHTTQANRALLREKFSGRLISKMSDVI